MGFLDKAVKGVVGEVLPKPKAIPKIIPEEPKPLGPIDEPTPQPKQEPTLPSKAEMEQFELGRIKDLTLKPKVIGPSIGTNPYFYAKTYGEQVGPQSYLYEGKVFNESVFLNQEHLDKPQILGPSGIVAVPVENRLVLADPLNPTRGAFSADYRTPDELVLLVNNILQNRKIQYPGTGYTITPQHSEWRNYVVDKYGLNSVDAVNTQAYKDLDIALGQLATVIGLDTPDKIKALGLMEKLNIFPSIPMTGEWGGWFNTREFPSIVGSSSTDLLAHEYGHALDYYIMNFNKSAMKELTEVGYSGSLPGISTDTENAFKKLHNKIFDKKSDYFNISHNADLPQMRVYYTNPTEMFARAFDYYVWDKSGKKQIPGLTWNFSRISLRYPVPEGKEKDEIFAAFDEFFIKLKVRETQDPTTGKTIQQLYQIAPVATLPLLTQEAEVKDKTLKPYTPPTKQGVLDQFFEFFSDTAKEVLDFLHLTTPAWKEETTSGFQGGPIEQLLYHLEGSKRDAYVINPKSSKGGVTVGLGVDLGQMNYKDLNKLGLAPELLEKLRPYLGLKKYDALSYLSRNPLTLTEEEAIDLNTQVIAYQEAKLRQRFNRDSYLDYDNIPQVVRQIMFSVAWQYGDLSKATPKFWEAVTHSAYEEARKELLNFGDSYSTRREYEAEQLLQLMPGYKNESR